MGGITIPRHPVKPRDVQGSLAVKVAVVQRGRELHGATLRHVAAPFHAVFLGVFRTGDYGVVQDVTARVFEEGFL